MFVNSKTVENSNYRDNQQKNRLGELEKHIYTFNKEMGTVKADVSWLKWAVKLILAPASIGALVVSILNFVK